MISADSRSAFCTRHRVHFVAARAVAGGLDRRHGCVTIVRQSARRKRAFECRDAIVRMAHPDAPSGRGACGDFAISVVRRRRNAMPAMARLFSDTVFWGARVQGCDASHRARILDTHLTHGCIQLFRRFPRVRFDYRECSLRQSRRFPRVFESATRTLAGVAR